jgi:hypothetical protein
MSSAKALPYSAPLDGSHDAWPTPQRDLTSAPLTANVGAP